MIWIWCDDFILQGTLDYVIFGIPFLNLRNLFYVIRNHYFYEIINSAGKSVYMQLALSAKNIPDDLKDICEWINEHFPSKQQKENWQWRCPFITSHVSIPEDMADEDIIKILSDQYAQLQEFEKKLVEAMNEEEH